jgi:hypothetical protein
VHAYKHIATRRYFHLAEDGRVFAYTRGGRYTEIHPRHAVDAVFDGWEQLRPEPEDPAVGVFRAARSLPSSSFEAFSCLARGLVADEQEVARELKSVSMPLKPGRRTFSRQLRRCGAYEPVEPGPQKRRGGALVGATR